MEARIQPITPPKVNLGDDGEDGGPSIHILFGRIRTEVFARVNGNPIRLHVIDAAASVTLGQASNLQGTDEASLAVLDVHTSQSQFDGSPFGPPPGGGELLAEQVLKEVFHALLSPLQAALEWALFTEALEPLSAFRVQNDHLVFSYRSAELAP